MRQKQVTNIGRKERFKSAKTAINLKSAMSVYGIIGLLMFCMVISTTGKPLCKPNWYFDAAMGHCDACHSICWRALEQGTASQCAKNCPGYTDPDNSSDERMDTSSQSQTAIIIASVIGAVVFVLIVVGAVINFHGRVTKWWEDSKRQRYTKPPIQATE